MTFHRLWGPMIACALVAGCADAPKPNGSAPQAIAATSAPGAPAALAQPVDPSSGAVGALKVGMAPDQAIAALGKPETQYDDFLSWNGGKLTAAVEGGHIATIRIMDASYSVGGVHVGQPVAEAQHAFPAGAISYAEQIPSFAWPNSSVMLELAPTSDHTITAMVVSAGALPGGH